MDKKVFPKSPEVEAKIRDILSRNLLFQHLDEGPLKTLLDAMFEVNKTDGEVIIQQGIL